MTKILDLAQRAYDNVALYRRLYRKRPVRDGDVPFISYVDFHQARSLIDCTTDPDEILGAVPAYFRRTRRLPITLVESSEEWDERKERLLCGLKHLGFPLAERRISCLLLADDATGPFACEMSNELGWDKHRASISYIDGRGDAFIRDIELFDPDIVIAVTPQLTPDHFTSCGRSVVFVSDIKNEAAWDQSCDRLLVCDELHVFGARRAGDAAYQALTSDIVFERVPESGLLSITNSESSCYPLIRYTLGWCPEILLEREGAID